MRLVRALAYAAALVVCVAGASRLEAQSYFGQNQVQYDHFKWTVTETDHFLVHYYPEDRVAAMDAARHAHAPAHRIEVGVTVHREAQLRRAVMPLAQRGYQVVARK